jgi:hypothetical protein
MGLVSSSSEIRTDVELPLSEIAGLMIQVAKIDYLGAYRLPRLISGRPVGCKCRIPNRSIIDVPSTETRVPAISVRLADLDLR